MFLHKNLTDVSLQTPEDSSMASHFLFFLTELVNRSPHVASLRLNSSAGFVLEHKTGIATSLSGLQNLTFLALPSFCLSQELVASIGTLPKLVHLDLNATSPDENKDTIELCAVPPCPSQHLFPRLESISRLTGSIQPVCNFLSAISNGQNLSDLNVGLGNYNEEALRVLLRHAAETCPNLKFLGVNEDARLEADTPFGSPLSSLTSTTLCQLTRFQNLEKLLIEHYNASAMTDADLLKLVIALPRITVLSLRCIPVSTSRPKLTLRALHLLSRFYRIGGGAGRKQRLECLHLHVDATNWPNNIRHLIRTEDIRPFESLKFLVVSASPIGDSNTDDIALYLSRILPAECLFWWLSSSGLLHGRLQLPLGSTPDNNPNHCADVKEMERRDEKWHGVMASFDLIKQYRLMDASGR